MLLQRQILAFVLLSLLGLPTAMTRAEIAACPGDCDHNGSVSVDDLILIVNIILGAQSPSACGAADVGGDGEIGINDAIAAVNVALSACPVGPPPEPASAALSIARALLHAPRLAGVVATAIGALGGSDDCERGGSYATTCEDSGAGTRLNEVVASACRYDTAEGLVELSGLVNVIGGGQCPSILVLSDLRFVVDGRTTVLGPGLVPLVDVDLDLTLTLARLIYGQAPCGIKGGEAALQGRAVHHTAGPYALTLDFEATRDVTEFADFVGTCDPARLRSALDGPLALTDTYGAAPFAFEMVLDGMVIGLDLPNRQMRLDGEVETDCFGGRARVVTLEPLDYAPEQPCFTRGVLALGLSTGTTQLTMRADGGVEVSGPTANATYSSCLDLPRQPCGAAPAGGPG